MTSLKQKTINGLFWSYFDSFGVYVIRFGFTIAIARVLLPSDYGLIGMIVIFIAIGNMLIESGFMMALIQKKDADNTDYSTIFWFNLVMAVIIYLALFLSSKSIASFYNQPILTKITKISSLNIIFSSLCVVHISILTKEMNFKSQSIANFISAFVSGITGVYLAYKGYAVWALVFQTIVGSFFRTSILWIVSSWRPKLEFNVQSFLSLFSYSYKILIQGATSIIFEKIYFPLIGKYFSAASLGFYTNANRFYEIFIRRTTIAYGRVTFPAFSAIQDNKEKLDINYNKTYRLLIFVMYPLSLFLIVSARPFVAFFLTDKWLPAVPLMKIFFLEGFFFPLLMLNQNMFNAVGRSDISLKVDTVRKILMFLSIFIAFKYGVQALIFGQVLSSFITFVLSSIVIMSVNKINIKKQFKEIIYSLTIISILYLTFILLIDKYVIKSEFVLLANLILIPLIYLLLTRLVMKNNFTEFVLLISDLLPDKYRKFIHIK